MAERSTLSIIGAIRLLVPRRILMAAPARWPRIMSTTSGTLFGDVRADLSSALANILSSSLRSGDGCGWWVVGKTYTHTPTQKPTTVSLFSPLLGLLPPSLNVL